jgi:hypothetical protein
MEFYGMWASKQGECGMWPVECSPMFGSALMMLSWWGQPKQLPQQQNPSSRFSL